MNFSLKMDSAISDIELDMVSGGVSLNSLPERPMPANPPIKPPGPITLPGSITPSKIAFLHD